MRTIYPRMAALLALAGAAYPQAKQEIRIEQYVQKGGKAGAPGAEPVMAGMIGRDGRMGVLNVVGKPFSGTEVRRTVQMLANGAKIESSDSNQLYRDDQGRTRAEQTLDGHTTIVIMDPVARTVSILDPTSRTVRRTAIPKNAVNGGVTVSNGMVRVEMGTTFGQQVEESRAPSPGQPHTELRVNQIEKVGSPPQLATQDLGEKVVNGVVAQGTRETRTIPAGAVGNDRELQLSDERWLSSDLQLMVKSINSDPRFGETTYQLTNIVRSPQDPALFQVPADYAVIDRKPGK